MKVGNDPEMTPRQQIASVAFAHKAASADVAATVVDSVIVTAKLADESVTAAKIAPQEAWHNIGATGELLFQSGWVNFGDVWEPAAYMKDSLGFVHLKGSVKSGAMSEVIFTMPAGYRPLAQQDFTIVSSNAFGRVMVYALRYVIAVTGATLMFHWTG